MFQTTIDTQTTNNMRGILKRLLHKKTLQAIALRIPLDLSQDEQAQLKHFNSEVKAWRATISTLYAESLHAGEKPKPCTRTWLKDSLRAIEQGKHLIEEATQVYEMLLPHGQRYYMEQQSEYADRRKEVETALEPFGYPAAKGRLDDICLPYMSEQRQCVQSIRTTLSNWERLTARHNYAEFDVIESILAEYPLL